MCMHVIWDDAGTTSYVLRAMYTLASLDHESAPLVDRTKTPCRQRDVVQLEPLAELLTRGSELTSRSQLCEVKRRVGREQGPGSGCRVVRRTSGLNFKIGYAIGSGQFI